VLVDPIKSTLKAPGTKRLKLACDNPLSKFGFKFNLRRYNAELRREMEEVSSVRAEAEAGAYTRSFISSKSALSVG